SPKECTNARAARDPEASQRKYNVTLRSKRLTVDCPSVTVLALTRSTVMSAFRRGASPAGGLMTLSVFRVYAALGIAAALVATGCSKDSNPAQPDSSLTASVAAPRGVSPASDAVIKNADQPVTLVVQNAVSTQSGAATTYMFEVATDTAFAAK